jgi:ribulose-5-phosphate 4-epimerase/fuculose-1-phosphate aldolase
MVAAGRALIRARLAHASSGNMSTRTATGFLIPPRGARLETLRADDLVPVCSAESPPIEASTEVALHAATYRVRHDVNAVVHTHSPYATPWSCVRDRLDLTLAEADYYDPGSLVPVAHHEPGGSIALAEAVVIALGTASAVLLARHGAMAVSPDLERAVNVSESLEHQAQVAWILRSEVAAVEDPSCTRNSDRYVASAHGHRRAPSEARDRRRP